MSLATLDSADTPYKSKLFLGQIPAVTWASIISCKSMVDLNE